MIRLYYGGGSSFFRGFNKNYMRNHTKLAEEKGDESARHLGS